MKQGTIYGVVNRDEGEYCFTYKADEIKQLSEYIRHILAIEKDATSFVLTIVPPNATHP